MKLDIFSALMVSIGEGCGGARQVFDLDISCLTKSK
jgi:hypothetical protein